MTTQARATLLGAHLPGGVVISDAKVWVASINTGGGGVPNCAAYYNAADNWDESTITWNNQPAFSNARDPHTAMHGWNSWDVTPDVQSAWTDDQVYSAVLKPVSEPTQYKWINFPTKEEPYSPSNHPYLEVTYTQPVRDDVVCEPQGGVNPNHPPTYWYDVTPGDFGRCDFHVQVFDPNPNNYTNVSLPAGTWQFQVQKVGSQWWASWWDPGCTNAIFSKFRFQFDNPNGSPPFGSAYSDWRTTTDGTSNPYAGIVDSSANHSAEPDGYGYRVHMPYANMVVCEPQGGGNPSHPPEYWYEVTTADVFCDFHVQVYDPDPSHYTNLTLPASTWKFDVHRVGNEWWASWWDSAGCANALFNTTYTFSFLNDNPSAWGHWTTTIDASNNPYAQNVDSSWAHSSEPDGYGYRVHAPVWRDLDEWQNLIGVNQSDAQWGDFDGDGDPDLAICGLSDTGRVTITYENLNGTLGQRQHLEGISNESGGGLGWGDYDGDGDLDLAMAGRTDAGGIARIYVNDGAGNLAQDTLQTLTGVSNAALDWGDFDNDGDIDLVITGHDGAQATAILYKNAPLGTLTADTTSLTGFSAGFCDFADYDGDGDCDLLLGGNDGTQTRTIFYENDPPGVLTDDGDHGIPGLGLSDAAFGDYDADGDLDLAVTGSNSVGGTYHSMVYANDGAGNFTHMQNLFGVYRSSCAWGDYDNDGDLDVALMGYTGTNLYHFIYENTGAGLVLWKSLTGICEGSLSWADVDGDGDLDHLMTGTRWGTTMYARLYENIGGIPNTPPSAPTGLDCRPADCPARLTWDASSDAETPQEGLYYCLRVGTSPGADDVASGTYGTPLMGNVDQNTGVVLDLPDGDYYWCVRSIDSGLMPSEWSDTTSQSRGLESLTAIQCVAVTS